MRTECLSSDIRIRVQAGQSGRIPVVEERELLGVDVRQEEPVGDGFFVGNSGFA